MHLAVVVIQTHGPSSHAVGCEVLIITEGTKIGRVGGGRWEVGGGEALKDFTKPRQTIQSPDRLNKPPQRLYKAPEYQTKPTNIKQMPKMFNKSSNKYQFNI